MIRGLDELVDSLVEKIALRGTQGADAVTIKDAVQNFYAVGDRPATADNTTLAPVVDDSFCAKVWSWLCSHKDVRVCKRQQPDDEEVEYLTVRKTRMWQTLTGHGPDPKRIPPLTFTLLSIIAGAGPDGILQPEITKLSGQDKRSVPKRTDELARGGYIEKRTVLANRTKTSICRLVKFVRADRGDVGGDAQSADDPFELAFQNGITRPDAFLDGALPLIKEAGIISLNDLKRHFNLIHKHQESRVLNEFLVRLEALGLIVKHRVKVKGHETSKAMLRSIQYIRDATPNDIRMFCALGRRDTELIGAAGQSLGKTSTDDAEDDDQDEQDDKDMFDPELDDIQRQAVLQDLSSASESTAASSITWTPLHSFPRSLFETVQRAGVSGHSTMNIVQNFAGPFYRRPVEQTLSQLTNTWERSQPNNLKHLAVIRDVGQTSKQTFYVYRTRDHFGEAARLGQTSWEAVATVNSREQSQIPSQWIKNLPLDNYGFPQIDQSLLLHGTGAASPAEARSALLTINQPSRPIGESRRDGWTMRNTSPPARKPQPKKPSKVPPALANLASKPVSLFRKQMSNVARRIACNEAGLSPDQISAASKAYRKSATEDKKRPVSPSAEVSSPKRQKEDQADVISQETFAAFKTQMTTIKQQLETLQYPTAYLNPPQRLAWKKGRPRAAALLVIKSERLKELPWFQNTDDQIGAVKYLASGNRRTQLNDSPSASFGRPYPKRRRLNTAGSLDERHIESSPSESIQVADASDTDGPIHVVPNMPGATARDAPRMTRSKQRASMSALQQEDATETLSKELSEHVNAASPAAEEPQPTRDDHSTPLRRSTRSRRPASKRILSPDPSSASSSVHNALVSSANTNALAPPATETATSRLTESINPETPIPVETAPETFEQEESDEESHSEFGSPIQTVPSLQILPARAFIASAEFANKEIPFKAEFEGMEKEKPFGCIVCGRRYKNAAGLEYHVNHAFRCFPERYEAVKKRDLARKEAAAEQNPSESGIESESDDPGDFLGQTGRPPRSRAANKRKTLTKRPRSRPSQTSPQKQSRSQTGHTLVGGGSVMHKRYEIILAILHKHDGAFPENRALNFVFNTAWRKSGQDSLLTAETLRRSVSNLVAQLKVQRLFLAYEAQGSMLKACILTLPDVLPNSQPVLQHMQGLKDSSPGLYIPQGSDIAEDLQPGTQCYPGNSSLTGRPDRYPVNTGLTVKRLEKPLKKPTASSGATAWARWADSIDKEGHAVAQNKRGDPFWRSREDYMEAQLENDQHRDQDSRKLSQARQMPTERTPRRLGRRQATSQPRRDTMHSRIQSAARRREHEIRRELAALEADVTEEQASMQLNFALGSQMSLCHGADTTESILHSRAGAEQDAPLLWTDSSSESDLSIGPDELSGSDIRQEGRTSETRPRPTVNPMAWMAVLPQSSTVTDEGEDNASLDITRAVSGRAIQTTLTDPDQVFLPTIGIFSTEFAVRRKLRPHLHIKPPPQQEFEHQMARALQNLDPRDHDSDSAATFHNFKDVKLWETRHHETLSSNMELIQNHWINHTVEPSVAAHIPWISGAVARKDLSDTVLSKPNDHSRRTKVLRRPPLRPRRTPAPEATFEPRPEVRERPAQSGPVSRRRRRRKSSQLQSNVAEEYDASVFRDDERPGARGPQTKGIMSKEQIDFFLAAIVIAQVLAGGREGTLDWPLVLCCLQGRDIDVRFARSRWFAIRGQNGVRIAEYRISFQNAFMQAAEAGHIEIPDFDNAADYDWMKLHAWTMENVISPSAPKLSSPSDVLPASRSTFDQQWSLGPDVVYTHADQDVLKSLTLKHKEELIHEADWSVALQDQSFHSIDHVSESTRAESWLRSNVLAKSEGYDAVHSRKLLESLPAPILDQALATYIENKWLRVLNRGRLTPGRNYAVHDHFNKLFRPDADVEELSLAAVGYKEALDQLFDEEGSALSTIYTRKGEGLALMNLVAAGRVELCPILPPVTQQDEVLQIDDKTGEQERLLSVFGLDPGNYVTREIAKDKLYFDISITPTASYIAGVTELVSMHNLPPVPMPHLDHETKTLTDRATPLWSDLQDRLLPSMWAQLLACVVLDLAVQSGRGATQLARRFKGAVGAWELQAVLDWLEAAGVARKIDVGLSPRQGRHEGGWMLCEWWWCLFVFLGPGHGGSADEAHSQSQDLDEHDGGDAISALEARQEQQTASPLARGRRGHKARGRGGTGSRGRRGRAVSFAPLPETSRP